LIHRLTYRRTNHDNIHVRGYKEEGTITTPFDMTVLNDLDRFHLGMDTLDRLPQIGERGHALKEQLKAKLIEHKHYIDHASLLYSGKARVETPNGVWEIEAPNWIHIPKDVEHKIELTASSPYKKGPAAAAAPRRCRRPAAAS
jgi:hypothetical protein